MREDICTIPVNEIMEVQDGCPICRMYATLEDHMLDFILGDAMMEPDVRTETNRTGFCSRHFTMMLGRKNRLSLALMLESRLAYIHGEVEGKGGLFAKSRAERAGAAKGGCYVCTRVDKALAALLDTFFRLWKKEEEFRGNLAAQPALCLPHYVLLLEKGRAALDKKSYPLFEQAATDVLLRGLNGLQEDVTGFCQMFDYRNGGKSFGDKRDAPERAVTFLTGLRGK